MGSDDFFCFYVEVDNTLISVPGVATGQNRVFRSINGDVGIGGREGVLIDMVRKRGVFPSVHGVVPSTRVDTSIGKYSLRLSCGIFSYQLEGSVGVRLGVCPVVMGGNARFI